MGSYTGTVPTFLAGELPDADKFTEVSNFMTAETDVWTNYSPTYGNLTIGNGTVVCKYKRIGKTIYLRWFFTWGSSSTSAAGFWSISLPVAALDLGFTGGAYITDFGVGQRSGSVVAVTTSTFAIVIASTLVASTNVPITWSAGDNASATVIYETA